MKNNGKPGGRAGCSQVHRGMTILFILLILTAGSFLPGQEEQELVSESVSVTNIEVPVRVLYRGKMVDRLTREDFKIFEGKIQREINGFYIDKKKLKAPDFSPGSFQVGGSPLPRYFVLVFRIHEMNEKLKEGVRYIFDHLLTRSDRLMILASGETLFFGNLGKKEAAMTRVLEMLEAQGHRGSQRKRNLMKRIRNIPIFGTEEDERADNYLKYYMEILLDYKKQYLLPEMESLYNFAGHLETIHLEKWIINFYQEETYPHFSRRTRAWINSIIDDLILNDGHQSQNSKIIHRKLMRIDTELNAARDFPLEVIQKLFVKTGAVFHSLLIPTSKPPDFQYFDGFHNWGFEYKRLSTDFENSFRELAKKTGGSLISSKDLVASMKSIEERQDICYWLTFAPGNPQKVGKIRVELRNPGYKPLYDDSVASYFLEQFKAKREKKGEELRLDEVRVSGRTLHIRIACNPVPGQAEGRQAGISLRVRVKDHKSRDIFDHQKVLLPSKETIRISIPLKKVTNGKYFALVEVKDLRTGISDFQFLSFAGTIDRGGQT